MSQMVLRSHTRAARQKLALAEKPKMPITRGLFEVEMEVGRWKKEVWYKKGGHRTLTLARREKTAWVRTDSRDYLHKVCKRLHVRRARLVRIPGTDNSDPEYTKVIEDYGRVNIPRSIAAGLNKYSGTYSFEFRLPLPRDSSWSTLLVSNRAVRNSRGKVAILFLTAARDIGDQKGQIVSLMGSFIEEPGKVGIFVPQEVNLDYARYGIDQSTGKWTHILDHRTTGPLPGRREANPPLIRIMSLVNEADYDMDEPVWNKEKEDSIDFEIYQGKAQKENKHRSPSFVHRAKPHAVYRPLQWSSPRWISDNRFLYSFNMDDDVGKLRLDPHGGTIESFPNQPAYRDWALALMSSADEYLGEHGGFDRAVGPINGLNNDPETLLQKVIKPAQPKNRLHVGTSRSTCCFVDETTGGFMN